MSWYPERCVVLSFILHQFAEGSLQVSLEIHLHGLQHCEHTRQLPLLVLTVGPKLYPESIGSVHISDGQDANAPLEFDTGFLSKYVLY